MIYTEGSGREHDGAPANSPRSAPVPRPGERTAADYRDCGQRHSINAVNEFIRVALKLRVDWGEDSERQEDGKAGPPRGKRKRQPVGSAPPHADQAHRCE